MHIGFMAYKKLNSMHSGFRVNPWFWVPHQPYTQNQNPHTCIECRLEAKGKLETQLFRCYKRIAEASMKNEPKPQTLGGIPKQFVCPS